MSEIFKDRPFPKGALLGAACLVGLSLALTAGARLAGVSASVVPAAVERVDSRLLVFEDRRDGAVIVRAPEDGIIVAELAPSTNGFVRAVLRGFARERRAKAVGAAPPFELILWQDGRLSLFDPETGRAAQMNAFGTTNLEAFAQLLTAKGAGS